MHIDRRSGTASPARTCEPPRRAGVIEMNVTKKNMANVFGIEAGLLKIGNHIVERCFGSGIEKRDTVVVDYTGWTTDGAMFDSSTMRGEPAEFRLDAVIPGWTEGVQLMTEGEKVRFWIPEKLAYKGRAGAPQGMLVFDVALIKIK